MGNGMRQDYRLGEPADHQVPFAYSIVAPMWERVVRRASMANRALVDDAGVPLVHHRLHIVPRVGGRRDRMRAVVACGAKNPAVAPGVLEQLARLLILVS